MKQQILGMLICFAIAAADMAKAGEDRGAVDSAQFGSVGGIDQWVTIRGKDCRNTPMLFVHGGPGDALSPFSEKLFAGWEQHFTLIQWDQPGAGKTFGKTGPEIASALSMDRIVHDGINVAEYALENLGHDKLILVGTSWGSIIGSKMARSRPDLFHAYVGVSQVVSMKRAIPNAYHDAIRHYERANNETVVADLEVIGPPPWDSVSKLGVLFRHIRTMRGQPAPDLLALAGPEFAPSDFQVWLAADKFSQLHFFGPALDGELMSVDLLKEPLDFAVPVYVFQGSEDMIAPPVLAERYLDDLHAPDKGLRQVHGAGHELLFEASGELLLELVARFGGD
jgi:pimeloyl-ACP methyl ester carboxylesterase